jgi:2-methylcitrate dehydratase
VIIKFKDGSILADELERANAHPAGAKPFVRPNYIHKFDILTQEIITQEERNRFINLVENLPNLTAEEVKQINVQVDLQKLMNHQPDTKGIF